MASAPSQSPLADYRAAVYYCGSNERERLKQLVLLYTDMLATSPDDTYFDRSVLSAHLGRELAAGQVLPRSEAFQVAMELARAAAIPLFFIRPAFFPLHCFHLDVLSRSRLERLVRTGATSSDVDDTFGRGLADHSTAIFAFTASIAEWTSPWVLSDEARGLLAALAAIPGTRFPSLIASRLPEVLKPVLRSDESVGPVFDCATVSQRELAARLLCLLFSLHDRMGDLEVTSMAACLGQVHAATFTDVASRLSVGSLRHMAAGLHRAFDVQWRTRPPTTRASSKLRDADKRLRVVADLIQSLFHANYLSNSRGKVEPSVFYSPVVAAYTPQQVFDDYRFAVEAGPRGEFFTFAEFPAMLDVNYKSHVVMVESIVEHHNARQRAAASSMFPGFDERAAIDQNYLILRVDRNNLVQSTLLEVGRKSGRLKKPLRVEFLGEPGIDEGGVRKEFFQLIVKSLMDPNFGMFYPSPTGTSTWIQPWIKNNQNKPEFRLIGQVIGLAVSNNIILDVAFPQVVFRKLLGLVPDFQDLEQLDPGLAGGLQALLSFEEDGETTVENTFCRMFTHEYDVFGQTVELPLKPHGGEIALTSANRQEYVDLVVQHVLTDAIRENFDSFKEGFFSVVDRSIVPQMRPEELELLVCGQPFIHLEDLADGARYEGYTAADRVIQWFWDVLFDLTEDQKKLFLRFVTGSDRVPVGGLKELHFVLGRNGDDDNMLPTSHTCFNHLLLPKYSGKEVLRTKLLLAIENCTGFGLR